MWQVYAEVDQASESREFNSVLTAVDMCEQLRLQTKELLYHRIPMWDDSAPAEMVRMRMRTYTHVYIYNIYIWTCKHTCEMHNAIYNRLL